MDQFSVASCYAIRYAYISTESIVGWILVALNVDRLIALSYPFWARKHITELITYLICGGILTYSLFYACIVFKVIIQALKGNYITYQLSTSNYTLLKNYQTLSILVIIEENHFYLLN